MAPLYDIASALPYDVSKGHRLKLAMKLGGSYRLTATDRLSSWHSLARGTDLPEEEVVARVAELASGIGVAFADVAADPSICKLNSDLPERLVTAVTARAKVCLQVMA